MLRAIKKAGKLLAFYVVVMIPINVIAATVTNYAYPMWRFRLFPFQYSAKSLLTALSFFTAMVFVGIAFPILDFVLMLIGIYFFFLPYSNVILGLVGPRTLQALFIPVVSLMWFPVTGVFWLAGIAGTFVGGMIGYQWFSDTVLHRIHRRITGGAF